MVPTPGDQTIYSSQDNIDVTCSTEHHTSGQAPVSPGEVLGHNDNAWEVHETKAHTSDDTVAQDESEDGAGVAGDEETCSTEQSSQHAALSLSPPAHQPRHHWTAQPIHSNLHTKYYS